MSKLGYYIGIIIVASVAIPLALAQSFTFNDAPTLPKKTVSNQPYSADPLPVMSPDNFKSGVQEANKQVQTNLDQQVTQSLKPMPVPAPKAPPPPAKEESTAPQNTQNKMPQKQLSTPQPVAAPAPTIQQAPPPVNSQPPNQQTMAPSPTMSQPQPYNGFGTPSQPSNTGSSKLNIQY